LNSSEKVTNKIWRIIDLINWGVKYFQDRSFENPRLEIEIFLQHIFGYKKIDLYINFEEEVTPKNLKRLREFIKRRVENEPIQYITGVSNFYGRDFYVNKNVLIPRPETEILVNVSIDYLSSKKNPYIIDVGTGSGCIAITLAKELPSSKVIAIDYSQQALNIAKENAELVGVKNIEFLKLDFLSENLNYVADAVVSNPPYIAQEDIQSLMIDVKEFEPHRALTDNADGLEFYRIFANKLDVILKKKGVLIIEVGRGNHPVEVKKLFEESGYNDIEMINDYNKDVRVLKIMK
jgi:release factor glutamine methyltransferase|tara:strand:+ start:1945 stop:2820 length:876 start_codon:yes stop_codon:yes gene_type:complete